MNTKETILDKIARTKKNTALTADQKTQLLAKYEKDLAALGSDKKDEDEPSDNVPNFDLPTEPLHFTLTSTQKANYDFNESENAHSENVLLLARASKNKELIKAAEFIVKEHKKLNSLPDWLHKFRTKVDNLLQYTTEEKPKKVKSNPTYKGKKVADLDDAECEEMRKAVEERRKKAAKSEKKSKSRPIIEKVAANVVTGAKQIINNIPVADIKEDPAGEIKKMERLEAATRKYLTETRSILGEDYDRDTIDGELKDLHKIITDLKKKYT